MIDALPEMKEKFQGLYENVAGRLN